MGLNAFCRALAAIDANGYSPFVLISASKRRVIHAPKPWLKDLQRRANERLLTRLSISDCVYSVRGRGVVANAKQHLSRSHMIAMDVKHCFPSTTVLSVTAAFAAQGIAATTASALTRLGTFGGFLPQGPPTSPAILNIVFRPIDAELEFVAANVGATYTRYMDDLCFSANGPLDGVLEHASSVVRRYGYTINTAKCRSWGPSDPHTITKIVVGTTLNPEPDFLSDLQLELLRARRGNPKQSAEQLRGQIDWVRQLNAETAAPLLTEFSNIFLVASRGRSLKRGEGSRAH